MCSKFQQSGLVLRCCRYTNTAVHECEYEPMFGSEGRQMRRACRLCELSGKQYLGKHGVVLSGQPRQLAVAQQRGHQDRRRQRGVQKPAGT